MAIKLPNGAQIFIASGYAASANVTALTNATEGVATATNTLVAGDYVEMTSGWSRLTDKIVRAKSPSGTVFTLEGYDTSSTTTYPAGTGVGSFRKISGWTQIVQILDTGSNGGDQEFLEYQLLEADAKKRIPTTKAPYGLELTIADDPTLAGYIALAAANDDRLQRAIRVLLPNGSNILYNAYVSVDKTPSLTANQIMAVKATLSMLNEPVRYAT
ncbi:phage tail protein [Lysobacter sp. HA35]